MNSLWSRACKVRGVIGSEVWDNPCERKVFWSCVRLPLLPHFYSNFQGTRSLMPLCSITAKEVRRELSERSVRVNPLFFSRIAGNRIIRRAWNPKASEVEQVWQNLEIHFPSLETLVAPCVFF